MEVGIRELRTNLAGIMDEVDQGTVVTITHHGKPRATIQQVAERETSIERGIREGWISVGSNFHDKRSDRRPRITVRSKAGVSVIDVLAADRDEL
jgi:prevent-host-death family protein